MQFFVHLKIGLQENVFLNMYSEKVEGRGGHFIKKLKSK